MTVVGREKRSRRLTYTLAGTTSGVLKTRLTAKILERVSRQFLLDRRNSIPVINFTQVSGG